MKELIKKLATSDTDWDIDIQVLLRHRLYRSDPGPSGE